jgi:hypothetical protein
MLPIVPFLERGSGGQAQTAVSLLAQMQADGLAPDTAGQFLRRAVAGACTLKFASLHW